MPWHISHTDKNTWKVVKDSDNKIVGTHDSYKKAVRHLAALNINVKH